MATLTGQNLLEGILDRSGVVLSEFIRNAIIARLNSEIAKGNDSGLAIAAIVGNAAPSVLAEFENTAALVDGVNEVKAEIEAAPEPSTGETFVLTTGNDVVEGTDGDDTIEAVASSLSSASTLDAGDQIDGGEGADTLNVDLQGNFTGFSGDGFLKNVETVVLNNSSAISRTFTATGVEGVEEYVLNAENAAVALAQLASTDSLITVNNQASGTLSVGYAATVTAGTSDTQAFALNNVGTVANTEDGVAEAAVTIDAAGIEEVSLAATGDNVVNMSGTANPKDIVASGEGSLKVTAVGTNLKTVNAAAVEGDVFLVVDDGATVTSISTGSGDDTIVADMAELSVNATIAAGAGDDNLLLHNGTGTVQYNMSGVENLWFADQSSALKVSGANTSGVQTVNIVGAGSDFEDAGLVSGAADQNIELVGFGTASLTYNVLGANTNIIELKSDASGAATVNVTADDDAQANVIDVDLTQAASVTLNVSEEMDFTGNLTAAKATSLEATIAGEINNIITLAAAGSVVINATNEDADNTVDLVADKATDLNITSAGAFTLGAGSSLDDLESVTISTAGLFTDAGNSLTDSIAFVNISGVGSADLGDLGSNLQDFGITLNASGLASDEGGAGNDTSLNTGTMDTLGHAVTVNAADVVGAVNIGAVDTKQAGTVAGDVSINVANVEGTVTLDTLDGRDITVTATNVGDDLTVGEIGSAAARDVTIDASNASGIVELGAITATRDVSIDLSSDGLTGPASIGAITVARNFTFKGAELEDNDLATNDVTIKGATFTADITGGIAADTFDFIGDATTTSITVSGNLNIGNNTVDIDAFANTTSAVSVNLSGLNAGIDGVVTVLGSNGAFSDTFTLGASAETVTVGAKVAQGTDKIVGFSTEDKIKFVDASTFDDFTSNNYGEAEDVNAAASLALADAGKGAAQAVAFVFDSKTYIAIDTGTDMFDAANDALIEVTGISSAVLAGLGADNFIAA